MRWDVLLAASVLIALLLWLFRRDQRRARAARADLLVHAAELLENPRRTSDALGFPVLHGRYAGQLVELTLLADTLAVRQLPSLWLRVTLCAPLPGVAMLDLLARAANTEFYSPAEALPHRLYPGADLPAHVQVKAADARVDLTALAPVAADFFSDPRAKEALITRRGVRVMVQVGQAERGEYLLLRSAQFTTIGLDRARVQDILRQVDALYRAAAQGLPANVPAVNQDADSLFHVA